MRGALNRSARKIAGELPAMTSTDELMQARIMVSIQAYTNHNQTRYSGKLS
jgi:hypothetical protein